jgi:predicted DNA-binding ribbon-helix-helix protein
LPRPGQKSITVPQEFFNLLKTLSEKRGTSIPKLLRAFVEEVGGLGNPVSQTATALGGRVKGGEVVPEKGGSSAGPEN